MRKSRGRVTMGVPNLWTAWLDLAVRTNEMLTASAFVINHRTDRMRKAGLTPSGPDLREFTRMVTEKNEAAVESAWAMSSAMLKMQTDMAAQAWKQMLAVPSLTPQHRAGSALQQAGKVAKSLSDAAKAGLAPVHSRAVANKKRLSKKRR
jgi:hypothetical protein